MIKIVKRAIIEIVGIEIDKAELERMCMVSLDLSNDEDWEIMSETLENYHLDDKFAEYGFSCDGWSICNIEETNINGVLIEFE